MLFFTWKWPEECEPSVNLWGVAALLQDADGKGRGDITHWKPLHASCFCPPRSLLRASSHPGEGRLARNAVLGGWSVAPGCSCHHHGKSHSQVTDGTRHPGN